MRGLLHISSVLFSTLALAACTGSPAEHAVFAQNAANTRSLAANIATLAASTRELARLQCEAIVQHARERTAADLVRIRNLIPASEPTDAELADPTSPAARALATETAALTLRINAAPPDQRDAAARSLADDHPATIDLAITSSGFTPARILRDAAELDRTNALIDRESNPPIRAGLLARRSTITDAYLGPRSAVQAAERYTAAVDRFLATIDEQSRIAGLHAHTLGSRTPAPSPLALYQSHDLRASILGIITDQWGARTAADIADRLRRADDALGALQSLRVESAPR